MINKNRLPESYYRKLCALVEDRDRDCYTSYEEYLGCGVPSPFDETETHHVVHQGSGGADREDNLILLSFHHHRFDFHGDNVEIKKRCDEAAKAYLQCDEVCAWREYHKEELDALYEKAEEAMYQKTRKKNTLHCKWGPMPSRAI